MRIGEPAHDKIHFPHAAAPGAKQDPPPPLIERGAAQSRAGHHQPFKLARSRSLSFAGAYSGVIERCQPSFESRAAAAVPFGWLREACLLRKSASGRGRWVAPRIVPRIAMCADSIGIKPNTSCLRAAKRPRKPALSLPTEDGSGGLVLDRAAQFPRFDRADARNARSRSDAPRRAASRISAGGFLGR